MPVKWRRASSRWSCALVLLVLSLIWDCCLRIVTKFQNLWISGPLKVRRCRTTHTGTWLRQRARTSLAFIATLTSRLIAWRPCVDQVRRSGSLWDLASLHKSWKTNLWRPTRWWDAWSSMGRRWPAVQRRSGTPCTSHTIGFTVWSRGATCPVVRRSSPLGWGYLVIGTTRCGSLWHVFCLLEREGSAFMSVGQNARI